MKPSVLADRSYLDAYHKTGYAILCIHCDREPVVSRPDADPICSYLLLVGRGFFLTFRRLDDGELISIF